MEGVCYVLNSSRHLPLPRNAPDPQHRKVRSAGIRNTSNTLSITMFTAVAVTSLIPALRSGSLKQASQMMTEAEGSGRAAAPPYAVRANDQVGSFTAAVL